MTTNGPDGQGRSTWWRRSFHFLWNILRFLMGRRDLRSLHQYPGDLVDLNQQFYPWKSHRVAVGTLPAYRNYWDWASPLNTLQ